MRIDMITLFPEMFAGPFGASITKRAVDKGILDIHFTNFRDYSFDKHRHVDDSPFGGGAGSRCIAPCARCSRRQRRMRRAAAC